MLGTTGFDVGSVLTVGNDSLPLVLYRVRDSEMENLILLKCGDYSCSDSIVTTMTGVGAIALAIGADGLPVIIY